MEQSDKMNRITNASLLQQKQEEFLSLQKQAQEGNVMAQYNVGICYLYGQNTKVDYDKAFSWFEKAGQQGDKLAGLFMGCFNELGVGRNVNYSQAINYYRIYSPSITEVDKTALWEKAKKLDEKEIEKNLSEIYTKAIKLGESILNVKGFCVYYPKDNSFNFKWDNSTRSEFKQPLEEYNKLVEEFRIYLDAYTSDSDDERYGYWMYIYEDALNLTYEICNALVGRDTLYRYLDKVGLPAIEKNRNFEFALGRCLIDDNDKTDNDYIISGLLIIAGHDDDPLWQNKVGLWYEYRNENKDLLQAELWYKKAAKSDFSAAQVNIERLIGEKEYKLITDKSEGSSEDRLKVVKTIRGNEELRNKWLLYAAILGNETATERLAATVDVKGDCIYNKVRNFEPSWKRIELEKTDCKKKVDTWKQIVEKNRKRYIEEEERRIKKEEEARRKAAEEEARRKVAEEEARRRAAEEEERRRQAELDALNKPKSKIWLWILIGVILLGILGGYYYYLNYQGNNTSNDQETDAIAVVDDSSVGNEKEFIEKLYNDFYEQGNSDRFDEAVLSKYFTKGAMRKFYVNIWDVIKEPVIVHLQVKTIDGALKIVDVKAKNLDESEAEETAQERISFEDALVVVKEMIIEKNGSFVGFQSPEKVENIMAKYGYKKRKRYFVYRALNLEPLYYKNCSFEETTEDDYEYSEVPSAGKGGTPSFVGIDASNVVVELFTKDALDDFLNQMKESGASLKEENKDQNFSHYELDPYEITVYTSLAWGFHYCIFISKKGL